MAENIKNHIYWTASTTTGPERVAKWRVILNHVRNIHTWGSKQAETETSGLLPVWYTFFFF